MDIIFNIDKIRKAKGWSDYKLVKASGTSPNTLINHRKPGANPTIKTLLAYCKALDCTLNDIIEIKESK